MAGLPALSDDEASADSPAAEGSTSAKRNGKKASDEDSDGVSSGESSGFDPKANSGKKTKGKGKGKGRAGADESGSDFAAGSGSDEEADDDDEMDEKGDASEGDPMVELVDEEDDDLLDRRKPKRPGGRSSNTMGWTGPRSAQTAYVQTEVNMIPQAYRALIKAHADSLGAVSRPPPGKSGGASHKNRQFSTEQLPFGPSTPFVTRLRSEPRGRGVGEIYVDRRAGDEEDWERRKAIRQSRTREIIKHITLIDPWQVWQGEGWWPEMATRLGPKAEPPGDDQAGTSRLSHTSARHHWTMRQDVRLGLGKVGRYDVDRMELLEPMWAATFPTSARLSD